MPPGEQAAVIILLLYLVFGVLITWVSLALQSKRWHDLNKSAWWILIILIPIVGPLWALIELGFLKGAPGRNRFGENPL